MRSPGTYRFFRKTPRVGTPRLIIAVQSDFIYNNKKIGGPIYDRF